MNSTLRERLEKHVRHLAGLGEKSTDRPEALAAAADYITRHFTSLGLRVEPQAYEADGVECVNLAAAVDGFSDERPHYIIGAHYDSVTGSPGADDNCSAVALLLETASYLATRPEAGGLQFVAFANEEPPHFLTGTMGSLVYARRCREKRVALRGMVCLESLGVFTSELNSQLVPPLEEPIPPEFEVGDFVALVDDGRDPAFFRAFCEGFDRLDAIRSLSLTLPELGVSDHWSFWQCGYPAVMVTDTAMYRNPHYHMASDTPEKLNYDAMVNAFAALIDGVKAICGRLPAT